MLQYNIFNSFLISIVQNWQIDWKPTGLPSAGQPTEDFIYKFTSKGQPCGSKELLWKGKTLLISCFIDQHWANIQEEETALYTGDETKSLYWTVKCIWSWDVHLFSSNRIGCAPLAKLWFVGITTLKENNWYQSVSTQTSNSVLKMNHKPSMGQ